MGRVLVMVLLLSGSALAALPVIGPEHLPVVPLPGSPLYSYFEAKGRAESGLSATTLVLDLERPRRGRRAHVQPFWDDCSAATLAAAGRVEYPLVLCFADPDGPGDALSSASFRSLSIDAAVFCRITRDREPAPKPEACTAVPACGFLADDVAGAYRIKIAPTVTVCDWYGNEYFRFRGRWPTADQLKRAIQGVPAKVAAAEMRLDKRFQAAKAAWEKQDRPGALRQILRNFRDEYVGLDAVTRTIALYDEIMAAARAEIAALKASGDRAGLEKVVKELQGTDAVKDAEEALDALGGE